MDEKELEQNFEKNSNFTVDRFEILLSTAQTVTQSKNLSNQLQLIAKAIVKARLFRRALISLFGRGWKRKHIGYAGISKATFEKFKQKRPPSKEIWEKIFSPKYQISKSYYIPHNDPFSNEIGGIQSEIETKKSGWHPNDYLFVPLKSQTKRIIGVISVDEPFDEFTLSSKNDTLRFLEIYANLCGWIIDRNRMTNKLIEQETYLKKIIAGSADLVITSDNDGKIRVWNKAAEKILGYKANEIIGHSVLGIYRYPKQAREVMKKMRCSEGTVKQEEIEVVSKNGETIPLSLSSSILFDQNGDEIGTVGISRDLRPIKELEKQKIEVERNKAIQKTVVALSHHINNQLMAQVALLSHLRQDISEIRDDKLLISFAEGLNKALTRSFQIAEITKSLQNPQDLEDEQYIGKLEMLSLPKTTVKPPDKLIKIKIKTLNIMVADDEPIIREGFAEFLRHFNMKVDTAKDGRVAIEKIKCKDYDLIISDIKMPYANGYEVFKTARIKNPKTNIILMTAFGYDPDHTVVKAARDGLKGVFFKEKPFQLELLLEKIASLFES